MRNCTYHLKKPHKQNIGLNCFMKADTLMMDYLIAFMQIAKNC